MKKLLNFSLAIIAVAFVACAYEDVALSTNESPSNPYEVTPDEAVQLLQTVRAVNLLVPYLLARFKP